MKPTIKEQITEVKREIRLREWAYPKWKAAKKYPEHELVRQMDRMRAVLETLQEVERMLQEKNPDPLQQDLSLPSAYDEVPF